MYFFFLAFGLSANTLPAVNSGIYFIENKGQWDKNVLFRADIPTGRLFVEATGLTYVFEDKAKLHELAHGSRTGNVQFQVVKMKWNGNSGMPRILKENPIKTYFNFFKGESNNWASHVQAFQTITLQNIYPGIHFELQAKGNAVKINYIVEANADANQIALAYEGANQIELKNGGLKIPTSFGEMFEEAPYSFQEIEHQNSSVQSKIVLHQNTVHFKLGKYDRTKKLVIDPTQIFGTYIGSLADNFGFSATYDKDGNAYGAGTVYDYNFPATAGTFDLSFNGGSDIGAEIACDVFISKFSADGSNLLFATYMGGAKNEQPYSLVVNPNNELVILGSTCSSNFPTTPGTFDNSYNGLYDLFVSKMSNDGSSLIASTFIGGAKDDGINGQIAYKYSTDYPLSYNYADYFRSEVICDNLGNIFIASTTQSSNFVNYNAAQKNFGGGKQDGIIVKFNPNLNRLLYSTFIGGSDDDAAYSLSLDATGNLFVCGSSNSSTISGATNSNSGNVDGIIAKYDANTGSLQKLNFHGTTSLDQFFLIQTDINGNPFVFGQTEGDIKATTGAFNNPNSKQFISKFNLNLDSILVQGTLGNGMTLPNLVPSAFMIDDCGKIYISGWGGVVNENYHTGIGYIENFTLSKDAFQSQTDGSDFYFAVFAKDMRGLNYASYYGGKQSNEHVDGGTSRYDKKGVIYQSVCAGCGGYSDFPTTQNAHSKINPAKRPNSSYGGCNLGLFKFDARPQSHAPEIRDTLIYITAGDTLDYLIQATDADADMLQLQLGGNLIGKIPSKFTLTDTVRTAGSIKAWLHFMSNCEDFKQDTFTFIIKVWDDACPSPQETTRKIQILVLAPVFDAPVLTCVTNTSKQSILIKWGVQGQQGISNQIQILKSTNKGPFQLIGTTTDISFTDTNTSNLNNSQYCYKLISFNHCGIPSDSSNEICYDLKNKVQNRLAFTNLDTVLQTIQVFDTLNLSYEIASNYGDSTFASILKNNGTILGLNSNLSYKNNAILLNLKWIPTCINLQKDSIQLIICVSDNHCSSPNIAYKLIQIKVNPLSPIAIGEMACAKMIENKELVLNWSALPSTKNVKSLHVLEKINGSKFKEVGVISDLNTLSYSIQKTFDWNQNYCYAVYATDVCDLPGDTSDLYCTNDQDKLLFPNPFNFVTVVNDKSIHLNWNPLDSANFGAYLLEKRSGRNGSNWKQLATLSNYKDTGFTDEAVLVDDSSYCYRMSVSNYCGMIGSTGKEACSILLKGTVFPYEYHDLNWLPYPYFITGINRFELYKTEPGIYADSLLAIKTSWTYQFQDKVLNPDNGLYQYQVAAFEKGFGQGYSSWSNKIELLEPPSLFVPNAITANGDDLNDVIRTVNIFVKTFQIRIYNRWGELIWESQQKHEGMPATYLEKPLANDVYFYEINYTGFDDKAYTKKGNISILR
jgi:gliding motility-associated-like protein